MFDEPVRNVMPLEKFLKAAPETLVSKAAGLMAAKNVGATMVVEDDRLIGIFTERDVVFRVVAQGFDARAIQLADVMTRAPHTVDPEKLVSFRSAMDPELEGFALEANRRKRFGEIL
jgi:CBS domain-containing protein